MNLLNTEINLNRNIKLKNPIMTASGTFGYGLEFQNLFNLDALGGIVTKAITPEIRIGNEPQRIAETECGMLNSIGLANMGLDNFLNNMISKLEKLNTVIFVNVAGKTIDDYLTVAKALNNLNCVQGIELNISCPNVKEGGVSFGANPKVAYEVTKKIRNVYNKHLMVKLSPNVTDIGVIAKEVENAGADSISLINTLFGMAIDICSRKSKIKSKIAGYSGPGIKPVAIANVYKCSKAVKIPIIGMGGIKNYQDVIEFMLAGASAVQIGTANFTNPIISKKIVDDLNDYLIKNDIKDIKQLIGALIE